MTNERMTPIETLLAKLPDYTQHGHHYRACCPAHGGDNPTALHITEIEDGRFLLYCHAYQCDDEAILAALGLTWADLYAKTDTRRNGGCPRPTGVPKASPPRTDEEKIILAMATSQIVGWLLGPVPMPPEHPESALERYLGVCEMAEEVYSQQGTHDAVQAAWLNWRPELEVSAPRLLASVDRRLRALRGEPIPDENEEKDEETEASAQVAPLLDLDNILTSLAELSRIADLSPEEKRRRVRRECSASIGALERSTHGEVVAALVAHLGWTKSDAKEFVRACVADAKRRHKEVRRERVEQARQARAAHRPLSIRIQVNDRQLPEITHEALMALLREQRHTPESPRLYIRGGLLTRIIVDEMGYCSTQVLTEEALKGILARVATWIRLLEREESGAIEQEVFPHADVVRDVLHLGNWPGLPALEGIVHTPVFGPDGTLHEAPGYNATTRLYHAPSVQLCETTPTPEHLAWAKTFLLDEVFGDFPFKDKASEAHAVALLLLPYVRQMIDGPTPLHLLDSPTPGTGKGLLATVCTLPAIGTPPPTMAPGRDSDEWRKRITAALLAGGIFVGIDNITQPLESGELASVLTQPIWQDRVLGTSHIVNLKLRTIWFATGNNVVPSEEIARRAVWIRLDANREKPWERHDFRHKKLLEWAKAHRADIVTAAVTLIRAWVTAGMPAFTGICKGSYERWSEVIGGILTTVGVPGFLANEAELYDTTVNTNAVLSGFITAWANAYGTTATGTTALFQLASFSDEVPRESATPSAWRNLLGELLGSGNERSRRIRLGKLLREHRDKVIAGYKIVKDTVLQGVPHYRLEPIPAAQDRGASGESGESLPTPLMRAREKIHTGTSEAESEREKNSSPLNRRVPKLSPLSPLSPSVSGSNPTLGPNDEREEEIL